ncbi:hypothetical protein CWC29_021985 [Pseudoalteromonas sp. S4498]|uniref:hypothetical protein n=1 Tax=Pseudoalteromonas TaxID=53246 RepID=UPI0011085C96|nr:MULTISPECIES: hypothetical protein [Pseudoalteromonas]MCG9760992.1 hypothetical protein [Pseudoalteromonas sp. Isolate6]NKC21452.1 hypothetical protein [Pseudoalteromonas galatheae]
MAFSKVIFLSLLLIFSEFSLALSLSEQVQLADTVVQGKVMSKRSEWRDGQIITLNQVLVRDDLSASAKNIPARNEIVITQLGGTALHPVLNVEVTQHISHQILLREGEEALYFTRKSELGEQRLVSGADSVVFIQGIGSESATLPKFKQLKVTSYMAPAVSSLGRSQESKSSAASQAVLEQEPLTLALGKKRIKELLKQKYGVEGRK